MPDEKTNFPNKYVPTMQQMVDRGYSGDALKVARDFDAEKSATLKPGTPVNPTMNELIAQGFTSEEDLKDASDYDPTKFQNEGAGPSGSGSAAASTQIEQPPAATFGTTRMEERRGVGVQTLDDVHSGARRSSHQVSGGHYSPDGRLTRDGMLATIKSGGTVLATIGGKQTLLTKVEHVPSEADMVSDDPQEKDAVRADILAQRAELDRQLAVLNAPPRPTVIPPPAAGGASAVVAQPRQQGRQGTAAGRQGTGKQAESGRPANR